MEHNGRWIMGLFDLEPLASNPFVKALKQQTANKLYHETVDPNSLLTSWVKKQDHEAAKAWAERRALVRQAIPLPWVRKNV